MLCLIFLAIFGVVNIIKYLIYKLFFKNENKTVPIREIKIPLYGHCENIEFIIRKILIKYSWFKKNQNIKIIFTDNGADYETLQICKRFLKSSSNITFQTRR